MFYSSHTLPFYQSIVLPIAATFKILCSTKRSKKEFSLFQSYCSLNVGYVLLHDKHSLSGNHGYLQSLSYTLLYLYVIVTNTKQM